MREQIGHRTPAKIPEPAPAPESLFAERLIGGRSQPPLPVELLWVDGIGWAIPLIILIPVGTHLGNAADAAALDQLHRAAKVRPAALLHPALQDALIGRMHGAYQQLAFLDGVGDRLFQVN